jgi:hypothetical protein
MAIRKASLPRLLRQLLFGTTLPQAPLLGQLGADADRPLVAVSGSCEMSPHVGKEQKGPHEPRAGLAIPWPLYFFSRSSVASLRNIGRRRFAAFARSQGNDTSMRSASSSTSMLAAAV